MRKFSIIRATVFTLLLSLSIGIGCIIGAQNAFALSLKSNAIIEHDTLMLSDIFSGIPENKDRALGAAPRPGQDMVLNARTLMRIAMALDLNWRPAHTGEYITLTRSATIVDSGLIRRVLQKNITDSMHQEGLDAQYSLSFNTALNDLVLPPNRAANADVKSLQLNHKNGKFDAIIVAPSKEDPIQTIRISGSLHRMIEIPVINEAFKNGMIIGQHDIKMITVREDQIQHDTALNAAEIIGMTPRRMIMSGKPIKLNDIQQPIVVKRGDMVTMVFKNDNMQLTAKGKALENGARGDYIRVANANTSRTIEGIVTAEREISIRQF